MTQLKKEKDWAKENLFPKNDEPAGKGERPPSAPETWLGRLRLGRCCRSSFLSASWLCLLSFVHGCGLFCRRSGRG